uniref:Uncharacterized protein n=1 Tax=Populus alba TaxID=43335 RepID=A0A4U5QIL6_POPAL|nr:hypothetical protein D5086_0000082920 [Populus alba]
MAVLIHPDKASINFAVDFSFVNIVSNSSLDNDSRIMPRKLVYQEVAFLLLPSFLVCFPIREDEVSSHIDNLQFAFSSIQNLFRQIFQFQQPLFHLPFLIFLQFEFAKSDLTDVSGTAKNVGNDTEITPIGLRMAQILAIKVFGQRTLQMQPRVSQSTACVAPDQNSAAVQIKPRVRRLGPESYWIKTHSDPD